MRKNLNGADDGRIKTSVLDKDREMAQDVKEHLKEN